MRGRGCKRWAAAFLRSRGVSVTMLTKPQIRTGNNGAELDGLTQQKRTAVLNKTPLWFYILREAELNNDKLKGVGQGRRRDVPPRDGGQRALDRPRPRPAPVPRPEQHDLPDGPSPLRLRGKEGAAQPARKLVANSRRLTQAVTGD